MRGRKPTPTELKLMRGNPGKRSIPTNQPKPTKGAVPPEFLALAARTVWERLAPELERLGLLNKLSGELLAAFCDARARWEHATIQISETGEIVKAPSGYPVQNPWRAVANKAMEQMVKIAPEFGMTPSSMTRLASSNDSGAEDPADEFFKTG